MHSTKRKSKEDTWKSEELLRHLKAAQGDHAEEADAKSREKRKTKVEEASGISETRERRHKEKDPNKDRVKDKDKEREKHKDRDRNQEEDPKREKDKETKKDRDRERHAARDSERDQIKERDREKDKVRERERHKDKIRSHDGDPNSKAFDEDGERDAHPDRPKERDKKSEKDREKEKARKKEKDRHREQGKERDHENDGKHLKHRHRKEDEENGNTLKSDKFEEKERKHREKKTKERTEISEQNQEKKRDENRDRRPREHKEREPDLRGNGRERRQKEKKPVREIPSEAIEGKHPEEREKGHGIKRHKDTKESNAESGDVQREHRDKQNENQQRRYKVKEKEKVGCETEPCEEIEKEEIIVEKPSVVESSQYEDDFEDYADDFEEDEDEQGEDGKLQQMEQIPAHKRAEIEEIQRAITAENERIFTKQSDTGIGGQTCEKNPKDVKESKESEQRSPARGTFIDFVSAKKREISRKAANRQKKRCVELLRLVDLDFSINFSLLDMPPLNEYDMYIKNFGRTNTKQAYIQCNEDDIDRNIQTEEIETVEKWTQHPGESNLVCGGPNTSDTLTSDSVAMRVDSRRLANFLRSACQVIAVLLEEDRAENQANQNLQSKPASLSISDGSSQLNTDLPFLHGRQVLCLHFSQFQRQTLLSVHNVPKEPVAVQLDYKYIICVWNIWEPSAPQKVLVCESAVQCCCFSPGRAISVFAGTVDGSVVLWDLRQHSSTYHTLQIGSQEWTFRSPTFSTDGVLTAVNHSCAVKAVAPVSSPTYANQGVGLPLLTSHEGSSGQSFQMASLDESGLLNLWVVVELQKAEAAGSLTDLGLSPGGKVKLLHSSSININSSFIPRDLMQLGPPQTLNIKFLPSDPNHFFIGTDIGLVSHGTLHGLRAPPKFYKPQLTNTRPTQVTSIDFCNFEEAIFLVGCSDGMIRLHSVAAERPLMQWNDSTQGRQVQAVQWALTRPAVFFVLDISSNIYVWDLLEDDSKPIAKENLPSDLITAMVVLGEPEKPNASSGVVLAKESGLIEIQYLKKRWSGSRSDEVEKLHHFLQQVI